LAQTFTRKNWGLATREARAVPLLHFGAEYMENRFLPRPPRAPQPATGSLPASH